MAEKDLVSMAQAFTGLPMNDLIGGPLMAAAEANNQMAMTQVKYILDTGLERVVTTKDGKEETTYKPIMVQMEMTQPFIEPGQTEDGAPDPDKTKITDVTTTIEVPLITILPVNALAVDDVSIEFDMEVKSSYAEEKSQETKEKLAAESSFEAKIGYGPFSASISGSVAYSKESTSSQSEKFEKSNSARYNVKVHAGQQPQPPGLQLMLEQFAKNIGPYVLGTDTTPNNNNVESALSDPSAAQQVSEIVAAGGGEKALVGSARVTSS